VVYGDREKINEVLINLVSNALKFTPEGGLIAISAKKIDDKVEIAVSDTGKGIPEAEVPKLFQKFSQVKGEKRGTGLGLYICRKILEIHEQTIWVESKLGEGTTFAFTLATYKPEVKTSDGHKILIVESDEPLAQMIERYFFEQKYEVKIASGMKEVREILQSELPKIAIIDWQLPNNEAIEIMDYIRNNERTEDMAILLLCDYREDIGGDFDAVVNKPINFKDLLMKANAFAQT
jgi:CheY-like chemotaxis protein